MPDKQIHALSAFDCADLQKDYALALEKIADLEKVNRYNSQLAIERDQFILEQDEKIAALEERIRVAEVEEPFGWTDVVGEDIRRYASDLGDFPLYLRAQIPADMAEHDAEVRRKVLEEVYKEVNCGITHVRWALEIIRRMAEQPDALRKPVGPY